MAVKFHAFLVGLGVFLVLMAGGFGVRWILANSSTDEPTVPAVAGPKPKPSATPSATAVATTAQPSPTPRPTTPRPSTTTVRPPTVPPTTDPPPVVPPPSWHQVWADDLDGLGNVGGSNDVPSGDACLTTRSANLFVDSGAMTLRAAREDAMCGGENKSFTSAAVNVGPAYTYGAFEITARLAGGTTTGLQPSFSLGGDVGSMAVTGSGPRTYRIEWEQGVVRYYIDGAPAGTGTDNATAPHSIRIAIGVNGPDDTTTFPTDLVVDSVRIYQFS